MSGPRRQRTVGWVGALSALTVAALSAAACGIGALADSEDGMVESPFASLVDAAPGGSTSLSTSDGGPVEAPDRKPAAGASVAGSAPAPVSPTVTAASTTASSVGRSRASKPMASAVRAEARHEPAPAADQATPPMLRGMIATTTGERVDVWTDGKQMRVARNRVELPRWSPDGSKLAYIDDENRIVVMSYPDWSVVDHIAVGGSIGEFVWSPDSAHVALSVDVIDCVWFYCWPQEHTGVWVAGVGNNALRQIGPGGALPSWDPSGSHVAYVVGPELHIATASGERSRVLHRTDGRQIRSIEWGPASSIAAVFVDPTGVGAPASQLGLVPVRDAEVDVDDIAWWERRFSGGNDIDWAPDRKALAVATRSGPLVTAGAGHPLDHVGTNGDVEYVSWSPDGRRLAFDDGRLTLIADVADGDAVALGEGSQPHWRHG